MHCGEVDIGDNLRFLQTAYLDLAAVLTGERALLKALADPSAAQPAIATLADQLRQASKTADTEYLIEEMPKAIAQALEGVERVASIVKSLKEFSHPDSGHMMPVDLAKGIESTLNVARSEYKYVADAVVEFAPGLPLVECIQGEINQVVLNLVVNAAHAIGDVVGKSGGKGTITIATRHDGDMAEIRITDTGTGIPERARAKIFDPFFTTKEVGKGTGQGLSMAHSIVVQKHHGTITFETENGRGTTFIVRIPIRATSAVTSTP